MRTLATLTALIMWLTFVFGAPAAKANCPHNGKFNHPHCGGGELESRVTDLEIAVSALEALALIGFSATEINPNADDPGFPGMHAACQEVFGSVARLCTGKEYALTLDVVGAPTSAGAWVQPVSGFGRGAGSTPFDCSGWTAAGTSGGTIVTEAGGFTEIACNLTRSVTCCAPAP